MTTAGSTFDTLSSKTVINNTAQSGGQVYNLPGDRSRVVEGDYTELNIHNDPALEWQRPHEFDTNRRWQNALPFKKIMDWLYNHLRPDGQGPQTVVVTGRIGSGKSTVVSIYVQKYGGEDVYTGGVLWAELGPQFNPAEHFQAQVERWERASRKQTLLTASRPGSQLIGKVESEDVQRRLGGHGPLLVVVDDLCKQEHFDQLMQKVLPAEAFILVTTRDANLLRQYEKIELADLAETEALFFLKNKIPAVSEDLLKKLAEKLGYHIQMLAITADNIRQQSGDKTDIISNLIKRFEQINEKDREGVVDTVLKYIYEALALTIHGEQYQRQLRWLGVLALTSGDFSTALVAHIWQVTPTEAEQILLSFYQRSLLTRTATGRWTMHALLRLYTQALLTDSGDLAEMQERYFNFVYDLSQQLADQSASWETVQPDILHIHYVGTQFTHRAETILGLSWPYNLSSSRPEASNFTEEDTQQLIHAIDFINANLQYILLYPETSELGLQWLYLGVAAAQALEKIENAILFLFTLSRWYLNQGKANLAYTISEEALRICEGELYAEGQAWVLLNMGFAQFLLGKTPMAIHHYNQVETLLSQNEVLQNTPLPGSLLTYQIELYLSILQPDKAMVYLECLLPIVEASNNERLYSAFFRLLGLWYVNRGEAQEALQLFERATPIVEGTGDYQAMADLLNNRGVAYIHLGEFENARELFDQASAILKDYPQPHLEATLTSNMANVALLKGNLEEALSGLNQVLDRLQVIDDANLRAQTLGLIGVVYERLSQPDNALDHLHQALPLLHAVKNKNIGVRVLNCIGRIYQATGRIQEGLTIFKEWLPTIREMNNSGNEATILNWIVIFLQDLGNWEEALQYFEKVGPIIEQIDDKDEQAVAHMLIGESFAKLGQLRPALDHFEEARQLWRQANNTIKETETLLWLTKISLESGEIDRAEERLKELERFLQDTNDKMTLAGYHNLYGLLHWYRGQLAQALEAFQHSAEINKEIDNPMLHMLNLNNIAMTRLFSGEKDTVKQDLEQALIIADEIKSEPHQVLIRANLGIVHYFSLDNTSIGIRYLEETVQFMEEHHLVVDGGNQSIDLLREVLKVMRDKMNQVKTRTPREIISLLIKSTKWDTAQLIIKTNQEIFVNPDVDAILEREIIQAREKENEILANVLRKYRTILSKARDKGLTEAFSEIIQLEDASTYYWWATLHRSARAYNTALTALNRAIEMGGDNFDYYIERGWVYRSLGNYSMAIQDFKLAQKLLPNNALGYQGLGVMCYELGREGEALQHLSRAIDMDKNNPYSFQWRGTTYYQIRDFEAAFQDLDHAVKLDPENTDHRYWRAIIKIENKLYREAMEDLEYIVEMDSDLPISKGYDLLWLGVTHQLQNKPQQAQTRWHDALALLEQKQHDVSARLCTGLLYLVLGQTDTAQLEYEQALNHNYTRYELKTQIQHIKRLVCLFPDRNDLAKSVVWLESRLNPN